MKQKGIQKDERKVASDIRNSTSIICLSCKKEAKVVDCPNCYRTTRYSYSCSYCKQSLRTVNICSSCNSEIKYRKEKELKAEKELKLKKERELKVKNQYSPQKKCRYCSGNVSDTTKKCLDCKKNNF